MHLEEKQKPTFEEFRRRRIREIVEGRPITPNPWIRSVRLEGDVLVVEVQPRENEPPVTVVATVSRLLDAEAPEP